MLSYSSTFLPDLWRSVQMSEDPIIQAGRSFAQANSEHVAESKSMDKSCHCMVLWCSFLIYDRALKVLLMAFPGYRVLGKTY